MRQLRAEAWTTHAKTTVVMDDETTITGKRVVAECYTEEHAALFAAAPELLEALQSAEMALIGYTHQNNITLAALRNIRAAIAKATGEQP